MAKVTVKMDKQGLKKITNAQITAARATAAKMLGEKVDAQQIPFGEGNLQNILTDVDDSAAKKGVIQIVSQGPYAARLYYNPQYNFNHEFNVNAQGEWWEDYISGDKKDRPQKIFEYFLKKHSGGYIE